MDLKMGLANLHVSVLLLLPSLELLVPCCCDKGAFSYVLSSPAVDPVYGVSVASTVPAVDLALDYINNNPTLLPGLNLTYGQPGVLEVSEYGIVFYALAISATNTSS